MKKNSPGYRGIVKVNNALIEPCIVPDIFCSGLARVEDIGNLAFRWTFFVLQRSIYDGGSTDHVVAARIIMPKPAALIAIDRTNECFAQDSGPGVEKKVLDPLHH